MVRLNKVGQTINLCYPVFILYIFVIIIIPVGLPNCFPVVLIMLTRYSGVWFPLTNVQPFSLFMKFGGPPNGMGFESPNIRIIIVQDVSSPTFLYCLAMEQLHH